MRASQTADKSHGLWLFSVMLLIPIFLLLASDYTSAQSSKRIIFALSTKDSSKVPVLTALHFGYFKDEGFDGIFVLMRSDIGVKALTGTLILHHSVVKATEKSCFLNGKIELENLRERYARKQASNPPEVTLAALVDYSILDQVRRTIK